MTRAVPGAASVAAATDKEVMSSRAHTHSDRLADAPGEVTSAFAFALLLARLAPYQKLQHLLQLFGGSGVRLPPKVATNVATFDTNRIDCDTQDRMVEHCR